MSEKRVIWVDIMKYLGIMLIMMLHLDSRTILVDRLAFPIYLPVFFFAAGYTYRHKPGFGPFFSKKVKTLLWPWLFFSVFNILLAQVFSLNQHLPLHKELALNFLQIRGEFDGVWFVAALFVAFLLFYWIIHLNKGSWIRICGVSFGLSLALALYSWWMPGEWFPWGHNALPWHLESMGDAVLYMSLGYCLRNYWEERFDRIFTLGISGCVWVAYLLMVALLPVYNRKITSFGTLCLNYGSTLLGLVAVVTLCKRVSSNRYINYVGANTLVYFALHGKAYSVMQKLLAKLIPGLYARILANMWTSTAMCLALTALLSVVLIIPAYIINRWFPFLLGRKRKADRSK